MRLHNRQMYRRYVRNVQIGDNPVKEVWHGDIMLYPTNTTLVRQLQIVEPERGTLDWAYWTHARRSVTIGDDLYVGASQLCASIGTDDYWLGDNRHTGLYSASLTDDIIRFGVDQGPCVDDLRDGDYITITATVPEHYDAQHVSTQQDAATTSDWATPFITGSKLRLKWGKGQKKRSAGVRYSLTSTMSGTTLLAGAGRKDGHGRGIIITGYALPAPCSVANCNNGKSGDDVYILGDTGMHGWFSQFNSCYYLCATPVYPAFTRTFKLRVKNILIQSVK